MLQALDQQRAEDTLSLPCCRRQAAPQHQGQRPVPKTAFQHHGQRPRHQGPRSSTMDSATGTKDRAPAPWTAPNPAPSTPFHRILSFAKSPSKETPLNSDSMGKVAQHRSFRKRSVQAGLFQATWRIILFPENQAFKSHQGFWKTSD